MKVAMIGLGKLGLPVACAMVQKGHEVLGFESHAGKRDSYKNGVSNLYEPSMNVILTECLRSGLHIVDNISEAVNPAEIIFVAVPTPSNEDGAFDTDCVVDALRMILDSVDDWRKYRVIAIISTVLPGTCRNVFLDYLDLKRGVPEQKNYGFAYNAQFIAMGSVIENMLFPEFVLVGEYDKKSGDVLERFYKQLTDAPILRMSIESAEMTKMIYNCYISQKIVLANTIMEMADKIPQADCDAVSSAISIATDRIVSSKYMSGGMGDGGGCHPRDNEALSWYAQQLNLRVNPFRFVTQGRYAQSRYLADIVGDCWKAMRLPVAILGMTFKPRTNLTEGSPALLLIDQLSEYGITCEEYDPVLNPEPLAYADPLVSTPHIYVIATRHEVFKQFPFARGSIIVDPWRLLDTAPEGCFLRSIGRHNG